MIKAVLFDVDNTLIDFFKLKRQSCEQAIDAMIDAGLGVPREKALKQLYTLYDKHGWEDQKIFQRLLRTLEGSVDYRKLSYGILAYRKAKVGLLAPYPKTRDTLRSLRDAGLTLGIVSDAPALQVWLRLASTQLDTYFDFVIASGKQHKGTSAPFKKAVKKLGLSPGEMLHVGDWPARDIMGAKRIGIVTCLAQYGNDKRSNIKADYEIAAIDELPDVIQRHQ